MAAPSPESERRVATVMFADVSGFTAMSRRLDPEDVTDIMNGCFHALEAVVGGHGGFVAQYIGDCLMAVFGLRRHGEDDPREASDRAVASALEIRDLLPRFSRERSLPAVLEIHVGIECGGVMVTGGGADATHAIRVVGETVALAEWLKDVAPLRAIWVGPGVVRALGAGAYGFRTVAPAALAGRARLAVAHEVLEAAGSAATPSHQRVTVPSAGGAGDATAHEGDRRHTTVLFAELSGLTRLSETPAIMRRLYALVEDVVRRHGGHVDKYVGDLVMALFGAPVAIEHAPRRAVHAAIDLRATLRRFNAEHAMDLPLGFHAGINSGLVLAGAVGGAVSHDFTVMGDTVNLASRLNDAAPAGEILLGPRTWAETRHAVASERVPALRLKGFEQPVQAHRIATEHVRLRPIRPTDPARDLSSELVGRDTEIRELRARLAALADRSGGIVSVVAPAGLGKSRLLDEVFGAEVRGDVAYLEGHALAEGRGRQFHPFVTLLRGWAGVGDDEAADAAGSKIAAAVEAILGADADAAPLIARLAGVPFDERASVRFRDVDAESLERLIAKHLRDLLVALAARRGCVVVIEDMHWVDESSAGLLISLLSLVREHPVLFVLAYRPDYVETSGAIQAFVETRLPAEHTMLRLRPLDGRQCLQLMYNLLASPDRPHPAWARILAKAEGNPFFIEQVLRSLVDQGAVVPTSHGYQVIGDIDAVVVPATVQEVIMARVDALPAPVRHLLQAASVIGRSGPHALLAMVVPGARSLDGDLVIPETSGLLEMQGGGDEATWAFTHALAQDTIYESILLRTRKALHLEVARAIEAAFAHRIPEFHGQLAHHYSRGDDLEKAEEYLFKAGEDAARSAASAEALALFREASRVFIVRHGEGGDPRKKALLEKNIGLALLARGELNESIRHFDRALRHLGVHVERTSALSYARCVVDLMAILAQLYLGLRRPRRVDDWGREREIWQILFNRGRAEITSDPTRLFFDTIAGFRQLNRIDASRIDQAGALYASCASVFCYSGISFAISRRALGAAKGFVRPDSVHDRFTCAAMDFTQDFLEGRWSDGHVVDPELLEAALRAGQLWDVNTYLGLRCDQHLRRGEFAEAEVLVARLGVLRDDYGYTFAGANHDGMLAVLCAETRRLPEALAAVDDYLAERYEDSLRTFGLGTKAKIQTLLGDLDGAAQSLTGAEVIVARSRAVPPWHRSALVTARLRYLAARLDAGDRVASAAVRRAIRSARRVAAMVAIQRTEIEQLAGRLELALGRRRAALASWRRSLDTGAVLGTAPELARTYLTLARQLGDACLGDLDAAACGRRAETLLTGMGLTWDLAPPHGTDPVH